MLKTSRTLEEDEETPESVLSDSSAGIAIAECIVNTAFLRKYGEKLGGP